MVIRHIAKMVIRFTTDIQTIKPALCNRNSITSLIHFKSVALLFLPSHHSGAMLSNPNSLIYCDLKPHHEPYYIKWVKNNHIKKTLRTFDETIYEDLKFDEFVRGNPLEFNLHLQNVSTHK